VCFVLYLHFFFRFFSGAGCDSFLGLVVGQDSQGNKIKMKKKKIKKKIKKK
jgi:hypothetical protein